MNRFNEGYSQGKRNARYFNSLSEIKERYRDADDSFLKGFVKAFDEYWESKLMGEF